MPAFRPWIGIEQIDARKGGIGQPIEQFAGVAEIEADVRQFVLVNRGQRLGDGIDESIRADEAGARMGLRLSDQMLGTAEADFQPQIIHWCCKQCTQVGRRGFGEIDCEPRQQRIE